MAAGFTPGAGRDATLNQYNRVNSAVNYTGDLTPVITTKKIHISSARKEIEIDFGLNIPGDAATRRMLQSLPIVEELFLYFIILDDTNAGILTELKSPAKRPGAVQKIYRNEIPNIRNRNGIKKVSLLQTLLEHRTIEFGATDLSNNYVNEFRSRVIMNYKVKDELLQQGNFNPAYLPQDYEYDTNKEAPAFFGQPGHTPQNQKPKPIYLDYEYLNTENLHLVCFVDGNFSEDSEELLSSGTDQIYYDLLLTQDHLTGNLQVPKNIDSYYVNDPYINQDPSVTGGRATIKPYHGPVHYHEEDPDNPTAYVGWMAGHRQLGQPLHTMGPRLEIRTTPNYKITSDLKVFTDQIDRGSGPGNETITPSWFSSEMIPNSILKTELKYNNFVKQFSLFKKDFRKFALSANLKNPNIVDYSGNETTFINVVGDTNDPTTTPLEDSHHGAVVGINFLEIIKYHSRLGYLMHLHEEAGNDDILLQCLYFSFIKDITFKRFRVVNKPYHINERQTKIFTNYDDNDPGTRIVSSSDRKASRDFVMSQLEDLCKQRLFLASSERGALEEVELMTIPENSGPNLEPIPGPKYSRQFILRDNDLFHNINFGNFSYNVEITLNDGIHEYLENFTRYAERISRQYKDFLFEASIPYKANVEQGAFEGNYNYSSKVFSNSFKQAQADNLYSPLETVISLYARIKNFLTGTPIENLEGDIDRLNFFLSLESGRIEDFHEFDKILDEMIYALKTVLTEGTSASPRRRVDNKLSSVKNATGELTKVIKVTSKTNVIAEAFSEEEPLADYSPQPDQSNGPLFGYNIFQPAVLLASLAARSVPNYNFIYVEPVRFISVSTCTYEPRDQPSLSVDGTEFELYLRKKEKTDNTRQKPPAGTITEVLTKSLYSMMPFIEKANVGLQMDYVFNALKDGEIGQTDKPTSYYPLAAFRYYGGLNLGLSKGILQALRGPIQFLMYLFDFTESGLTDEVKQAICESAYRADNESHFVTEVVTRYAELLNLRDGLGNFYYLFARSFMNPNLYSSQSMYNVSPISAYNSSAAVNNNLYSIHTDIFKHQSRGLKVSVPGRPSVAVKNLNINIQKRQNYDVNKKKLLCLNMQSCASNVDCKPVNNVVFMEV